MDLFKLYRKCPYCDGEYTVTGGLTRHINRMHKEPGFCDCEVPIPSPIGECQGCKRLIKSMIHRNVREALNIRQQNIRRGTGGKLR